MGAVRGPPRVLAAIGPLPPVSPGPDYPARDVELVAAGGSPGRGGGAGGHYWHIFAQGERAGSVFINVVDEPPLGEHASIQIFLNKASQGHHIGRHGYRKAAEQSSYDRIYAHMRTSNVPSRRAAEAAGFRVVDRADVPQLLMVWERDESTSAEVRSRSAENE